MTTQSKNRRGAAALGSLAAPVALGLLLSLGLTACGEDSSSKASDPGTSESSSTPSETPTETPTETEPAEPTTPACEEVWVAGVVLPKNYNGCYDAEKDKWVEAMVYRCSSGQKIVTHERNFYGAKGQKVIETTVPLAKDKAFQKIMGVCGA